MVLYDCHGGFLNKADENKKKKRKVDVTILTSNKVDFRAKEEGHFIMMKESIFQRNVRILKYYAPNNIASPYI